MLLERERVCECVFVWRKILDGMTTEKSRGKSFHHKSIFQRCLMVLGWIKIVEFGIGLDLDENWRKINPVS